MKVVYSMGAGNESGLPQVELPDPTDPAVIRARDMGAEVASGFALAATPSGERVNVIWGGGAPGACE
jgi:hypothetical protein